MRKYLMINKHAHNFPFLFSSKISIKKEENGEVCKTEIILDKSNTEIIFPEFEISRYLGDLQRIFYNLQEKRRRELEYLHIMEWNYSKLKAEVWVNTAELRKLLMQNMKCPYFNKLCSSGCTYYMDDSQCCFQHRGMKTLRRAIDYWKMYVESIKSKMDQYVSATIRFQISDPLQKTAFGTIYSKSYTTRIEDVCRALRHRGYSVSHKEQYWRFSKVWKYNDDGSQYDIEINEKTGKGSIHAEESTEDSDYIGVLLCENYKISDVIQGLRDMIHILMEDIILLERTDDYYLNFIRSFMNEIFNRENLYKLKAKDISPGS